METIRSLNEKTGKPRSNFVKPFRSFFLWIHGLIEDDSFERTDWSFFAGLPVFLLAPIVLTSSIVSAKLRRFITKETVDNSKSQLEITLLDSIDGLESLYFTSRLIGTFLIFIVTCPLCIPCCSILTLWNIFKHFTTVYSLRQKLQYIVTLRESVKHELKFVSKTSSGIVDHSKSEIVSDYFSWLSEKNRTTLGNYSKII